MALIAVGGNSGSGKTTSIRNLNPAETFLIQTIPKPIPIPQWKTKYPLFDKTTFKGNRYVVFKEMGGDLNENMKKQYMNASTRVVNVLKKVYEERDDIKHIIYDDSQYMMAFEIMARGNEMGYDKYSSIAYNFFNVMKQATLISEKLNVVFLHHTENAEGLTKLKTSGKMFDNVVTLEGLFTIVLMTRVVAKDGKAEYQFVTHTDGTNTVKSPMGMFKDDYIPNDLAIVFDTIKKYE